MSLGALHRSTDRKRPWADTPHEGHAFDTAEYTKQANHPLALPAASQQYPVLPQAAAMAAAASALYQQQQGLAGGGAGCGGAQWGAQTTDSTNNSIGRKVQLLDQQQQLQRRKAGPVNQWRPGMPLVTQQQPAAFGTAHPQPQPQQQQHAADSLLSWPAAQHQQQQQQQHVRPSGAAAAGGARGMAAANLQSLLPLPGQLMAAQRLPAALLLHQPQQQQQLLLAPAAQQPPNNTLQGITIALPASSSADAAALLSATNNRPSELLPSATAAGGFSATGLQQALAAGGGGSTAGHHRGSTQAADAAAVAAAAGALQAARLQADSADPIGVGAPGWLKLLSCAVEQQGDSLALELLLGGQLYKGQLTRVSQAGLNGSAVPGSGVEPELLQPQQPQQPQQQELSGVDRAALLEFAQQREGMCLLCALPFAQQLQQQPQAASAAAAAAAATADAGAGCTAAGGAVSRLPGLGVSAAMDTSSSSTPAQVLQQEQQDLMAALGSSVRCELTGGSCVLLHQACAEWSAKAAAAAAGGGTEQQQQGVPSPRQLLGCLPRHCSGCNQRAASLQCAVPSCNRAFHVPCVQAMDAAVLQDGSCWCADHQDAMLQRHHAQQQQAASAAAEAAAAATNSSDPATAAGLASPEPSKQPGLSINPSPSFAAALVLQQMRCSKGFDVLLVGPDPAVDASAGTGGGGADATTPVADSVGGSGSTRSSAQRRLLEAMPVSTGNTTSLLAASTWQAARSAGLYDSTAEASRQYHMEQQQQQGAYGAQQGRAAAAAAPATTMLLQRLQQQQQQQAGGQASWQQQQQHVGPARRSPKPAKGRPPLHAPAASGKAKGWNTLGLISAFALAQQQEEVQQHQQQLEQQQLAASHAAAAEVAVSGPTVVVPRVRARKGAIAQQHPTAAATAAVYF